MTHTHLHAIYRHAGTSFLRDVSLTASTYMFAPGDIVLYSGDMGMEMYCIRKGYVEVCVCACVCACMCVCVCVCVCICVCYSCRVYYNDDWETIIKTSI